MGAFFKDLEALIGSVSMAIACLLRSCSGAWEVAQSVNYLPSIYENLSLTDPWSPYGWVVSGICPQSQLCRSGDRKSSRARYLVNLFKSASSRSRERLYKTLN